MKTPPAGPDLSIIVVFYSDVPDLRRCMESLPAACASVSYELLVADNSPKQDLRSDSATRTIVEESNGTLISCGRNLGLSRATNTSLEYSSGRYCLCLNPDIVAQPGSIARMITYADETPDAGIVAARLENPDGSLQLSCRRFYTIFHGLVRRTPLRLILPRQRIDGHHLMADYDHIEPKNVDWVLGSCMLVRRQALEEVGPMDTAYFLYFEDVDWCYRMHLKGWDVMYFPDATMVHDHRRESATRGFSRQKWSHLASFFRFHSIHGWGILLRLGKADYPSRHEGLTMRKRTRLRL